MSHVPVLIKEVIEAIAPVDGAVIADGTYGGGGYASGVLAIADCKVIAIDRDPAAMQRAFEHAGKDPRVIPASGCFSELESIVRASGFDRVDGVMLDLGVSSFQLDQGERGFSFMREGPLDMRMGAKGPSAADAVNHLTDAQLSSIFHHLGEEPSSRRIAKAIVQRRASRKFETTLDLAETVEAAVGGRKGKRTHPATRVFQALRMFVNDELGELARGLLAAERVLAKDGRLVVVTFHSLEDRMVKTFLRERAGETPGVSRHLPGAPTGPAPSFELLERKAIEPSDREIDVNPRARSARLRWALRTAAEPWAKADFGLPRLPALDQLEGAA